MSKEAYVTLATNDTYGLGALVLGRSLRRVATSKQTVVMITPDVSQKMKEELGLVYDLVVTVNTLDSGDAAHLALMKRPELGVTFTKLHAWNLVQFSKCVFLDADTLVVQNCDELFERDELSAVPDPGWPDCFNSGVFVFVPSETTFKALIDFAIAHGSFDGGDQGLLNMFFRDWATKDIRKHLLFTYNLVSSATYSYLPALKFFGNQVKIVHFLGSNKPWLRQGDSSSTSPYQRAWWSIFREDVASRLTEEMIVASSLTGYGPPPTPPPRYRFNDPWVSFRSDKNRQHNIPINNNNRDLSQFSSNLKNSPVSDRQSILSFPTTSNIPSLQNDQYNCDKVKISQQSEVTEHMMKQQPYQSDDQVPTVINNCESVNMTLLSQSKDVENTNIHEELQYNVISSNNLTILDKPNLSKETNTIISITRPFSKTSNGNIKDRNTNISVLCPFSKTSNGNLKDRNTNISVLCPFSKTSNGNLKDRNTNISVLCPFSKTSNGNLKDGNTNYSLTQDKFDYYNTTSDSVESLSPPCHGNIEERNAGIAGNLARGAPEDWRRDAWEAGDVDYLGRDSFDNIWRRICECVGITAQAPSATSVIPPAAPTETAPKPAAEPAPAADKPVEPAPVSEKLESVVEKPAESTPAEKPTEPAPPAEKPTETTPAVEKQAAEKPVDPALPAEKPSEPALAAEKPAEPALVVPAPASEKPVDPALSLEKPAEPLARKPEESKPAEKPAESAPIADKPVEVAPLAEPAPGAEKPAEPAPTVEKPVEVTPIAEKAVEPVAEKPTETAPAEKPAEPAPVDVKPAEPAPVAEKPAEPAPVDVKPAEPAPVAVKPAETAPVGVKPAEPSPAVEKPVEPSPVAEKPVEPVVDIPAAAAPATEKTAEPSPVGDKPLEAAPAPAPEKPIEAKAEKHAPAPEKPSEAATAAEKPAEQAPAEKKPEPVEKSATPATPAPVVCPLKPAPPAGGKPTAPAEVPAPSVPLPQSGEARIQPPKESAEAPVCKKEPGTPTVIPPSGPSSPQPADVAPEVCKLQAAPSQPATPPATSHQTADAPVPPKRKQGKNGKPGKGKK